MKKHLLFVLSTLLFLFASTFSVHAQAKLWGMTSGGGSQNLGTIFNVDEDGTNYSHTSLVDFSKGSSPQGSLVQAGNGKLYGMTINGGLIDDQGSYGVIFEFDPTTNTYTKKFHFDSNFTPDLSNTTGSLPSGSLTLAPNGKLYGMARDGGAYGQGVIFEFDPNNGAFVKKIDFESTTRGSNPFGNNLLLAANGKFYGMTNSGGASGVGVLFEFNPMDGSYSKKIDFERLENGANPYGDLIQASNGKLYGMTYLGGSANQGCIFEYDLTNGVLIKKIDFQNSVNGAYPSGSLVQALNGKLYGTTNIGGVNNNGILFEFDFSTGEITIKSEFDAPISGNEPRGALRLSPNGKLYGMNSSGGAFNGGVLFEYDPATASFTKKSDFTFGSGVEPHGSLIVVATTKIDQTITFGSLPVKTFGDASFNLIATSTSGLAITYSSSDPTVATVIGNTVTILSGGTTTIIANQPGNSSYNAASPVQQTLTIKKANQTITFAKLPIQWMGDAPFNLTASSTSGLAITYTSSNSAVASISGNTVTIKKAGITIITASQAGNSSYKKANSVYQALLILPNRDCENSSDKSDDKITVFPNPTSNLLTIHLNNKPERKEVSIFQMDGLWKASQIVSGNEASFNVAEYLNGVYLVKIVSGNSIDVIRFTKQ